MAEQNGNGNATEDLQQQEQDDAAFEEMQATFKTELDERLRNLNAQFHNTCEGRISTLEGNYEEQVGQRVRVAQEDVLRCNKIIREVSKGLGEDWKFVFENLMVKFPKEEVVKEMEKIERQKPFIQAFSALSTWRDSEGAGLNLDDLVTILRDCNKHELADLVLEIRHSDADSLLQIGKVGMGITHAGRAPRGQVDGAAGPVEGASKEHPPAPSGTSVDASVPSPLGDRKLLQLAKQIGADWKKLASSLSIPDEEICEIEESEGDHYQGASFKVLHYWREMGADAGTEEELVDQLDKAFLKLGRSDLRQLLKS